MFSSKDNSNLVSEGLDILPKDEQNENNHLNTESILIESDDDFNECDDDQFYDDSSFSDPFYLANSDGPLYLTLTKGKLSIWNSKGPIDIKKIKGPFYLQNKTEQKIFSCDTQRSFFISLSEPLILPESSVHQKKSDEEINLSSYRMTFPDNEADGDLSTDSELDEYDLPELYSTSSSESKLNTPELYSQPSTSSSGFGSKFDTSKFYSQPSTSSSGFESENISSSSNEVSQSFEIIPVETSEDIHPKITSCDSCSILYESDNGIELKNCSHKFCKNCMLQTIQQSDFLCSLNDNLGNICQTPIHEDDISYILEENEATQNIEDYTEANVEATMKMSIFACAVDGCEGFIVHPEEYSEATKMCEVCQTVNCLLCRAAHDGLDCEQYWQQQEAVGDGSNGEYLRLIQLEFEKCIPNAQAFDCTICMEHIARGEGVALHGCLHTFCRECLRLTIEHNQEAQVKCPSGDGCESVLEEREVRELSTEEMFQKYLQQTVTIAEKSSNEKTYHCKTPNCCGFCFLGDENIEHFDCPACKHINCLKCQAVHEQITCQQYQVQQLSNPSNEDIRATGIYLERMKREGKAMSCPKCNMIVMKEVGCDGMICTMCKSELCWATKGLRWGPNGKGDTSGGCRCRVNGIPCSPNCQNCH